MANPAVAAPSGSTSPLSCLPYTTEHLFIFLSALLAGLSIQKAYASATRTTDPRNAYRWMNKLQRRLMDYRGCLAARTSVACSIYRFRSRRLQLLLPTFKFLFQAIKHPPCQHYQLHHQSALSRPFMERLHLSSAAWGEPFSLFSSQTATVHPRTAPPHPLQHLRATDYVSTTSFNPPLPSSARSFMTITF